MREVFRRSTFDSLSTLVLAFCNCKKQINKQIDAGFLSVCHLTDDVQASLWILS